MELANQTLAQSSMGIWSDFNVISSDFLVFSSTIWCRKCSVENSWREPGPSDPDSLPRSGADSRCCSLRSKLLKICSVAVWRGMAQLRMHRCFEKSVHLLFICFQHFATTIATLDVLIIQYVSIQSRRVDISLGSGVPVARCKLAVTPQGAGIQCLAQQPYIPFHFWSWRRNLKLRLTWICQQSCQTSVCQGRLMTQRNCKQM